MMRYADLKNNAYSNLQLDHSGLPAGANDQDPKGFGAGFRHTF